MVYQWALVVMGLGGAAAVAPSESLFVTRHGQVLRLADLNDDDDYLDFAESLTYAAGLPTGLGAIVANGDNLYVVDGPTASLYVLRDLNADGDAFDFAEVLLYAQLVIQPTPAMVGLAVDTGGALLTLESVSGMLYRVADLNGDGDALDAGELLSIANDLTNPVAVSVRPDGRLLVALQGATVPIRILHDLNGDGDYFDFAENISYAESAAAGTDLVAVNDRIAFLARPAEGRVMRLYDWTRDNDVLDFAEIVTFAEGLPAPARLALDGHGDLLVAGQNAAGPLYRLRDLNSDGDALDFAEALVVADGITPVGDMVFVAPPPAGCVKGDVDGNTIVNTADIAPLVNILLGTTVPADPCPADTNNDGQFDGRDIQPFIEWLL